MLEAGDSALKPELYCMRAITGAQFGKNAFDMAFHRMLRDRELVGDDFVGVPIANHGQYLDLAFG